MAGLAKPALWKAFIASFLVYLLPLVGPHGALPWGVALAAELSEGLGRRHPAWIAADVALALVMQGVAAGLFYWVFRRPGALRILALLAAVPALWALLMWSYMWAIPRFFLVEADSPPEVGAWEEHCRIQDAYLPDVKVPPDLSLEKAGRAFVARGPESRLGLLQTPGCEVADLGVTWTNYSPRIVSAAATGAILYTVHDRASDAWSWSVLGGPSETSISVVAPPNADSSQPVLSTDGKWVAWVVRSPAEDDGPKRPAVVVESLEGREAFTIELRPFSPSSFRLDHLDADSREVVVTRGETEFVGLGWDGTVRWGPWRPDAVEAWAGSRRSLGEGWAAWDAYREDEPYRLEWSMPRGRGVHTVRRGYRIQSAAVDPEGRFIALSVAGQYSFPMPDWIYVVDVAADEEVFRRELPQYSRSAAAFLGSDFFAYKDGDDVSVLRHARTP